MKRIVLIGAGVLVILVVVAALVLPSLMDVEKYRPTIEQALSSATGRAVSLGSLRLSVLPLPTLTASGITVGEDPSFGKDPFLKADRLEVRVRLLPLLAGRVALASITIDAPTLNLRRHRDKGWSIASLVAGGGAQGGPSGEPGRAGAGPPPPPAAPAAGSSVSLSIGRLRLAGGTVTFVDDGLIEGKTLTTEARRIDLTATDLSTTSPVGVDLSLEIAGGGRARLRGRIGPPAAQAGSPGAGAAAGFPVDARLTLDGFQGGAAAPYLAALTGVRIHGGSLDLDANVKGQAPQNLDVEGKATLKALEVDPLSGAAGERLRIDASVDLAGSFTSGATHLSRCDVKVAGSTLSVTGAVTGLRDRPVIEARIVATKVAVKDVAQVLRWIGPFFPAGVGTAGEMTLDAAAKGPLDDPAKISLQGTATVAGLEYSDPSLKKPLTGIGGTLALKGDRAEITNFAASLGASRVAGACTISRFDRPWIDVRLASPNLDLDEILAMLVTTGAGPAASLDHADPSQPRDQVMLASADRAPGLRPAGEGVVFARREGAPPAAGASILRDVTVRGELKIDQAKVMNLRLTEARTALSMERGEARLSGISLNLYKGTLTGDVTAALADAGPPFTLSARLQGVDFNALASDFSNDLRDLVFGTLRAELQVQGRGLATADLRRNLAGRGTLDLADGKITSFSILKTLAKALQAAGGRGVGEQETPFTSLTGTFDIAKGKARTEDLKLDSAEIDMKGKGSVALDLSLDLDAGARISEAVTSDMIARTPNLKHLQDDKGRLALDFRLGGTLLEPSIGIDPDMLKRAAKSAVREQMKGKEKDLLKKLFKKD